MIWQRETSNGWKRIRSCWKPTWEGKTYRKGGFVSPFALYSGGLRLGEGEAHRRARLATALGRFTAMTGERLEPSLTATEAAVADGEIGRENVLVIAEVMEKVPAAATPDDRTKAEAMLAEKVKKGGVGTWGQVPMPPNANVTEADAKKLATWVLAQK